MIEIGNTDLRHHLELAVLLIDHSPYPTQNTPSIVNLRQKLGPAIQFLDEHPGAPTSDRDVPPPPDP